MWASRATRILFTRNALGGRATVCVTPFRAKIPICLTIRNISGTSSLQNSSDRLLFSKTPEFSSESVLGTTDLTGVPALLQEPTHVNSLLSSTHYVLESIHAIGLPWWATIFCATFLLRTAITTPVAIYQQRAVGRMIALTPVLQAWLETYKTSIGVDHKLKGRDYGSYNSEIQNAYRAKVKELYSTNRCNPRVSFLLPWVQIPLFITMSLTIRGMAGYPLPFLGDSSLPAEPGFTQGGTLWFMDLAASDPTWIMPIAIGATNLLNVELNGLMMNKTPTRNQIIFRNVFRALAITMIPIAHEAPMAICLYWLSSGSYSVIQNLAFRMSTVRQKLKLPPLPSKAVE
ncbi:60Kd inner membrane protein-domain-containing protein [Gamsiella multidivaricata]|uniref:60Kd inner membrane protein-domain-containing protein n=1 Tax=Gamsiella multidivaricata TaxID=101098 RepID=UPI00221EF979|nr:60Kd inner membrane protein-domain-containing protein [Gamsiella multidivaricata]KAG0364368.1 Cytochrome c oxidase assembly protein cox18, mitochondrial [Gamsiella multidivaricata]KAI7828809.1 60Kd inner membrane protein-domain-containing protein [Gamsiella multidivaricata]